MSRDELVEAYLDGRISRRALVRRLVAAGVSTGAAISYAQLLSPQRAAAAEARPAADSHYPDSHYPTLGLEIKTKRMRAARKSKRVAVAVSSSEELASLSLQVYKKTDRGLALIGSKEIANPLGVAGKVKVKVAVKRLGKGRSVKLVVRATAADAEGYISGASASRKLR